MNNLQQQGRDYYKRGDYRKAIEHFDRAIGRGSASVQLLDNRAACHEKLNDFSTALKDAKKAIQLHREDATGYLRAGKVLVKMQKKDVALDIYTHGLKCIKHVGQGYETLRKAHKDLMNELSPPKSVDPLTMLPRELAEVILEHLDFRQRINACLVSKPWSRFIRSVPTLWRHLDLSRARKQVRSAFVSRAINTGRDKLTTATLSHLYDFDKTLESLLAHCPLEELTLLRCGLQSSKFTSSLRKAKTLKRLKIDHGTDLNTPELRQILSLLSERLEAFECNKFSTAALWHPETFLCPNLTVFKMNYPYRHLMLPFIDNIAAYFPNVQSLHLSEEGAVGPQWDQHQSFDLGTCKVLRDLDLNMRFTHANQVQLPESIVSLKLGCSFDGRWRFFTNHTNNTISSWFLPSLEVLELRATAPATAPCLTVAEIRHALSEQRWKNEPIEVTPVISKIRSLRIEHAASTRNNIATLLSHPRVSALESLHVPRLLDYCGDDTVTQIVEALPKVRSLDLSGTDITGVGVKSAVNSKHVQELIVDDCRHIGRDAIDWARECGIRVKYRTGDSANGGRKVRY